VERSYPDDEVRMRLVVAPSRQNRSRLTGGPFTPAVFTGALLGRAISKT
jgi:hypothetical protein